MTGEIKSSAGIVIVTRNREGDLGRVFALLQGDEYLKKLPVVVYDDASDSVTAAYWTMLNKHCVKVLQSRERNGYISGRNLANSCAPFDLIFSLDDDSCFLDTAGVVAAVEHMHNNPQIGVLSFPIFESKGAGKALNGSNGQCASFTGCGHLLRKDLFVKLGGYRVDFVHQVEELEFSMRVWGAGYKIERFSACPVEHWASDASRDWRRMAYFAPRNQVFTHFLHTPWLFLPLEILWILVCYLKLSLKTGMPGCHVRGWLAGLVLGFSKRADRKAMNPGVYWDYRRLQRYAPR